MLLGFGHGRKNQPHPGPQAINAHMDDHLRAMLLGDALDNRQPKPAAAGLRAWNPVKPVKHPRAQCRRDARPLIAHRTIRMLAANHLNQPISRRITRGVVEQVAQQHAQAVAIAHPHHRLYRQAHRLQRPRRCGQRGGG